MATTNLSYSASAALTQTLASLATSSTLVAGRQSTTIDNNSGKHLDELLSVKVTVGTTPTAATTIEVWVFAKLDDTNYPDTFGASDANVTVTSRDILAANARLAGVMNVPVTTSNVAYYLSNVSVASLYGGTMPKVWGVFIVHNTGVNLNSTGGNHSITHIPVDSTTA